MPYKNFLIIASKLDKAGINITTQLSQFSSEKFKFYLSDKDVLETESLDLERINQFDFVIFASKHASSNPESKKTLSVHAPGNPGPLTHGGLSGKVCKTSSQMFKQMFEKLNENAKKFEMKDYEITMEVTHHGPLIEKPCLFIEVGPTETEWNDRRATFVIAKTISDIIEEFKENPYNENAIAIGGPHYCPNFNKLQLESNIAISHIIPKHNLPITEELMKELIEKTEEEIDLVLLDWKGLGNSEQREKVIQVLDKLYLRHEKTGDVKK